MHQLTYAQYKRAVRLLNYPVTKGKIDCGKVCKALNSMTIPYCCWGDKPIDMHPFEKRFLTSNSCTHCDGIHCKRDNRPLECLMYPITPIVHCGVRSGEVIGWTFHPERQHGCALYNRFDWISKTYLKRAKIAWEILLTDTRFRKKVEGWQRLYADYPKISA